MIHLLLAFALAFLSVIGFIEFLHGAAPIFAAGLNEEFIRAVVGMCICAVALPTCVKFVLKAIASAPEKKTETN